MAYNSETHKLDMWLSNDEPAYAKVQAQLRIFSRGRRWNTLRPTIQSGAALELRDTTATHYGSGLSLIGWAREMLDNAYDAVDWAALAADYIDQIAEDEGN